MKKYILIIGIIFVLFAVVLSGCNEQSENKVSTSKFIGTWETDLENETWTETWTFSENMSAKNSRTLEGVVKAKYYNWENKDGELCITPETDPIGQRCGTYEFTNNYRSFSWTMAETNTTLNLYKVE